MADEINPQAPVTETGPKGGSILKKWWFWVLVIIVLAVVVYLNV